MYFEHIEDYQSRYQGRWVRIKQEGTTYPALVREIRYDCNDEIVMDLELFPGAGHKTVPIDDPDVVLDFSSDFMARTEDGSIVYCSRYPDRQWSQGFRPGQYQTNTLYGYGYMERGTYVEWALAPTYNSVEQMFEREGSYILDKRTAVTPEDELFIMDVVVGIVNREHRCIELLDESKWVRDHLHRKGFRTIDSGISRDLLKQSFSFLQLRRAGIHVQGLHREEPQRERQDTPNPFEGLEVHEHPDDVLMRHINRIQALRVQRPELEW